MFMNIGYFYTRGFKEFCFAFKLQFLFDRSDSLTETNLDCVYSSIRFSKSCSTMLRHLKSIQCKPSSSSIESSNYCLLDLYNIMWLICKAWNNVTMFTFPNF